MTLITQPRLTRRATLSAAAVAKLAGCASRETASAPPRQSDVDLLNVALGLEYEAIAVYQLGADSKLLQPAVAQVALAFQADHREHAKLLDATIRGLGGRPVEAKDVKEYAFRTDRLTDQAAVLTFAAELEKGAASAYLSTVPVFQNRELAKAAASILGAETQHWSVLRAALGQPPIPGPFIS
ncbi:MAG: ferritin-like domain-containing protein [Alphaproteobacteria bacterium]|nr:ferritin-like domain-containing protein [Alphaproteobacteria bacterium]